MKLKEQFSVIGTKNSGPKLTSFFFTVYLSRSMNRHPFPRPFIGVKTEMSRSES